jgi:hypothetical protein
MVLFPGYVTPDSGLQCVLAILALAVGYKSFVDTKRACSHSDQESLLGGKGKEAGVEDYDGQTQVMLFLRNFATTLAVGCFCLSWILDGDSVFQQLVQSDGNLLHAQYLFISVVAVTVRNTCLLLSVSIQSQE